jgi:hypothetical protein
MTSDTAHDKPAATASPAGKPVAESESRYLYGPRPVGAMLPALIRPAFRRRSAATALILADWEAIVGPALAAVTAPRRLSAGCLTIGCNGPMAMELQHLAAPLLDRVNAHLGEIVVTRLRLLQDIAPPPPRPPRPKPPDLAGARAAVAHLPEGELRDALERLGRAVLTPR